MSVKTLLLGVLAWIGRQRGRAVAAILIIGIALPAIGAALKPYVGLAVFLILVASFARADLGALKRSFTRPGLVLAATAWTMIGVPALTALILAALSLKTGAPDLYTALMLHAMTSPMMSAPAFASLLGFNPTLALAALIAASALLPFTAAAFAALAGLDITLSPLALGAQLGLILLGAAFSAFLIRRRVSLDAIRRCGDPIDGFNIVILYVFVAALMSDIASEAAADPLRVAGLAALAFGVFFAVLAVTALIFRRAGREEAFAIGLLTCQRNLGLMLAAAGAATPPFLWLYVAVCQFPIYLAPLMLSPLVKRMGFGSNPKTGSGPHETQRNGADGE